MTAYMFYDEPGAALTKVSWPPVSWPSASGEIMAQTGVWLPIAEATAEDKDGRYLLIYEQRLVWHRVDDWEPPQGRYTTVSRHGVDYYVSPGWVKGRFADGAWRGVDEQCGGEFECDAVSHFMRIEAPE